MTDLIENTLGMRTVSGYQYGEIFRTRFNIFFYTGEVVE